MRNIVLNQVLKQSTLNPNKNAIVFEDGIAISYLDCVNYSNKIIENLTLNNINQHSRIALIGVDDKYIVQSSIAVVETCTLVTLELSNPDLLNLIKLFEVNYIFTDKSNFELIEYAKLNDIGLILQKSYEPMSLEVIHQVNEKLQPIQGQVSWLIPTSGTTSLPKIVPEKYESFNYICKKLQNLYDYDSNTIYLQVTSIQKRNTLRNIIFMLCSGGTSIICGLNYRKLVDTLNGINRNAKVYFRIIPSTLNSFVNYIEQFDSKIDIHLNRKLLVGGSRLTDELYEKTKKIFNSEIVHTYGSIETGNIASSYKSKLGYKRGFIGEVRNHEIKIIDDEICVKGTSVFDGYLNFPNEEIFIDGWFKTGDIGYLDADGYLKIIGRKKEMINRGGEKVSPYEIEDIVLSFGLFKEVAIFPYPGENGIEEVGMIGVLEDVNQMITIEDVRNLLLNKIQSFKLPTKLVLSDFIQKSSNGKVQRKSLYQIYENFFEQKKIIVKNQSFDSLKQYLIYLWNKTLNNTSDNIYENFYARGGDSLKAAELFSEVESYLQVEIPMVAFLQNKTIYQMEKFLNSLVVRKKRFKFLVPLIVRDNDLEPLFFVHTPDGQAITYQSLASQIRTERSIYAITFNIRESNWKAPYDVDTILDDYINEIKTLQPKGPYYLAGLSMGGRLALEISHKLRNEGFSIGLCCLYDTVFLPKSSIQKAIVIVDSQIYYFLKEVKGLERISKIFTIFKRKINTAKRLLTEAKNLTSLSDTIAISEKMSVEDFSVLSKKIFKKKLERYYDFETHYFLAKRNLNRKSFDFLKNRTRKIKKIVFNCHHSDFINFFSAETANEMGKFL